MTPESVRSHALSRSHNVICSTCAALSCFVFSVCVRCVTSVVASKRPQVGGKSNEKLNWRMEREDKWEIESGSVGGLGSSQPSGSNLFHLVCSANERMTPVTYCQILISALDRWIRHICHQPFSLFFHREPSCLFEYSSFANYFQSIQFVQIIWNLLLICRQWVGEKQLRTTTRGVSLSPWNIQFLPIIYSPSCLSCICVLVWFQGSKPRTPQGDQQQQRQQPLREVRGHQPSRLPLPGIARTQRRAVARGTPTGGRTRRWRPGSFSEGNVFVFFV